jgi:hypothetical protein
VLPSHGKPFTGLHERIGQLQQHHDERLADVLAACRAAPCSAAELLPVLFKRSAGPAPDHLRNGRSINPVPGSTCSRSVPSACS